MQGDKVAKQGGLQYDFTEYMCLLLEKMYVFVLCWYESVSRLVAIKVCASRARQYVKLTR